MARKIKHTCVYIVEADNGEKWSEDRIEYTAGVFVSEEAALQWIKTTGEIPTGCESVEVQLWDATINERVDYFSVERISPTEWARWNSETRSRVSL